MEKQIGLIASNISQSAFAAADAYNQISSFNVALNYVPYGAAKNRKFDYKKQKARLRKNKAQRKARKISNHK